MASLPKNDTAPKFEHVFPNEKGYFDTTSSTVNELRATTAGKYGSDYGVKTTLEANGVTQAVGNGATAGKTASK